MCEMIRSLVHYGYFPMTSKLADGLNEEFLYFINCVGDDYQTKVCAFNEKSFNDKANWFVLLEPAVINFGGVPSF